VKTTMAGMGYAVMGTAVGRGQNRAMDAAMAAMASPLLEAGAIDGARGILINITGSSTLKLSEVNEASTIIQNAAHEDCNIIFGAVQDERMKDEVKITVIATGFKQDMPDRRARMISEATTLSDYQVPIRGRAAKPESAALFASEERELKAEQPASRVKKVAAPAEDAGHEGKLHAGRIWISPQEIDDPADDVAPALSIEEIEATQGQSFIAQEDAVREPELVPVAASVFDDDFFRASARAGAREDSGVPHSGGIAREQRGVAEVTTSDADELDIPAFLRRSH